MDYESLYATATKALNSQVEKNDILQAENNRLKGLLKESLSGYASLVTDIKQTLQRLKNE